MSETYNFYKLSEVTEVITDGSHNPPKGVDQSHYLMLSSRNIFNDKINVDRARCLSKNDFEQEDKRTNLRDLDVLLTIVGTIGRAAVFKVDLGMITLQRSVAVIRPIQSKLNSRFLMFSLQSMLAILLSESRGVAQQGFYLDQLRNLRLFVPSLEKQREIVEKLDIAFAEIELLEGNLRLSDEKVNQLQQSLLSASFSPTEAELVPGNPPANQRLIINNEFMSEFSKIFSVIPDSKTKIKSSEYLEFGKYAVVDQGKELVSGFTNGSPTVAKDQLPVIVFGDHTRAVKYVDFPFSAGADGTQILKPSPSTRPKYGYYLVLNAVGRIPSKGYARHFVELKKVHFPLPSLEKQNEIVKKLDIAFAEIESLTAGINIKKSLASALRQSLLSRAFTKEEVIA